jgi:hypothetical protein
MYPYCNVDQALHVHWHEQEYVNCDQETNNKYFKMSEAKEYIIASGREK